MLRIFLSGTTQSVVPWGAPIHGRLRAEDHERNGGSGSRSPDRRCNVIYHPRRDGHQLSTPSGASTTRPNPARSSAPVTRNREHYTGKVNYVNDEGKRVGVISIQSPSFAAYNVNTAAIMNNAVAMGGESARETCHHPAGAPCRRSPRVRRSMMFSRYRG